MSVTLDNKQGAIVLDVQCLFCLMTNTVGMFVSTICMICMTPQSLTLFRSPLWFRVLHLPVVCAVFEKERKLSHYHK